MKTLSFLNTHQSSEVYDQIIELSHQAKIYLLRNMIKLTFNIPKK